MSDVENTSQREQVEHLAGAMVQGTEGYITGMEAAGQAQLVNSTLLPYPQDRDDAPFIALGFKFGAPREGDDLFREAELPEGWKREGSDHSMWSYIVDEQGFRRVGVFYKAAFYDRRADMHIERVPRTQAQSDAYETVHELIGYGSAVDYAEPFWRSAEDRREGANYVYCFTGCKGEIAAERDGDRYPHGGVNRYVDDGRRIEVVVAPDGSIVETRPTALNQRQPEA